MTSGLKKLSELIIEGKHIEAEKLTEALLKGGADAKVILDEGLLPGMEVVGNRFRSNLIFLPQVLVSARAMKYSLNLIQPALSASNHTMRGKIILGTVKGDVHDIGKNIVAVMLQGAGFEVIDIGTDCPAEKFLAEFQKNSPDLIGISAMLTTTMLYMKAVIEYLRKNNAAVPVIIGGAPVTKDYAAKISADGYAKNAYESVELVKHLIHK